MTPIPSWLPNTILVLVVSWTVAAVLWWFAEGRHLWRKR
jgi:hypothetical protein